MSGSGKYFRPGKKFLRPPQQEDDDDDEEEDEDFDDEEEEEEADVHDQNNKKSKTTPKKSSAKLSSDEDDEEEEDEEEEDEEEEEEVSRKKRKKGSSDGPSKKRSKASAFFDEEAEAEDDDEDDDEPYGTHRDPHDVVKKHYSEEDIRRERMDDEALAIIRQQDRRRAQAGQMRFGPDVDDVSVAEVARDIEVRHRMQRSRVDRAVLDRPVTVANVADEEGSVAGGPVAYTAVSQQSLVPSVSDPSLWMVSCAGGKEQELVFQIMNKCTAYARQGKPLGICGAIASQTKGKIYIESFSEPAVMEAIHGIRGLLQYTMKLVPIQDMTTIMTVAPKKKPVKKDEWVRMTRGHYKGDLALVKGVRESGLKCIVQCVPRLDLTISELSPEEARIRRRAVRPPQKFFNPQELAALGKQTLRRQRFPGMDFMCDYYEGNYYHDGYLLKEMTVGSMIKPCTDEDPPTLDELQSFRKRNKGAEESGGAGDHNDENEGSKMASSLLDELSELQGKTNLEKSSGVGGGLLIGDTVEVIEGDLVGMRGKLVSLDGTIVKIKPTNTTVETGEVDALASQVRKYIAVGAHVKVTDGRYANETGVVVAVEQLSGETDFTAVVLTDVTNTEITVRTSQLRESAEVASGQDKLAGYELYDLVVLSGGGSANEVGVIVRVGREDFAVINNHGIVREVRPEELRGKRNSTSNRAVALDVQGNQIRCGDTVNIAEGPHRGKTATIKRISRAQLFLYSQTRSENAGIFVVRSRSCLLAGSRNQNRGATPDNGATPFSTPNAQSRGGPGVRGKRDDGLIGKTVRIQAGQWKGYLGAVADATATHVQVELHSRLKKVMVVRERVVVVGDRFGATEEAGRDTQGAAANLMAPTTPFISGGATPMPGGATPMHGGATPMHDGMGGGDEVWRPGGAIDQDPNDVANGVDDDGWGSTNNQTSTFGSEADRADGWGASSAHSTNTWAPQKQEDPVSVKQESLLTTNTAPVKREQPMEADIGDDGETAVWFMERVRVQLKSDESQGFIKEIYPDKSALVELDDKSTRNVRVSDASVVPPKEHDMVLVTGGADVGVEGKLVCIDGTDAILKDSNEDFKIVDYVHLVVVADS